MDVEIVKKYVYIYKAPQITVVYKSSAFCGTLSSITELTKAYHMCLDESSLWPPI